MRSPRSRSPDTVRTGRFAAGFFGNGVAAAVTSPRKRHPAVKQSPTPSTSSKVAPSSTVRRMPCTCATPAHDGKVYLDLCDADWRVVEIDAAGWRVVQNPPVRFRRAKAMLPLPMPVSGGSVDDLRGFLNCDDSSWRLMLAWLLAALAPRGPYPVLALFAESGAGKSTSARVLRSCIDPNDSPLRQSPREPRDVAIAASNSLVVTLENVSTISSWLSDCLCVLSTGGGFSTRTLFENDEETIFNSRSPRRHHVHRRRSRTW